MGIVAEEEAFAGLDFAAGADEGGPDVFVGVLVGELLGEEDFDAAGGVGRVVLGVEAGAGGVEARGEDAGVVEDQEVAFFQVRGKVGEVFVGVGVGVAV